MSKAKPEVLIAGAGPVGMFAAIALAKRGVRVQIVDTGLWACSHSYALALHPRSVQLMQEAGLDGHIWELAYRVNTIGFCDASGCRAQIRLDADSGSPLAVVRQSALEDLFERTLLDLGTPIQWRHEVAAASNEGGRATARVDQFERDSRGYVVAHTEWVVTKSLTVDAAFVIGADGHDSQVRRSLGLNFPEVGPAHYYAVFEFKSDYALENEMRIVMGDRSTDVLWRLPDGFCRWSFQLPDYSDTEAEQLKDRLLAAGFGHFPTKRLKDRVPASVDWGNPPALDEEHLHALIAERAPWFTGSIENVSWRTIVRFERRLASSFGQGRVWLAGDAAHLTGPAGVQSMNLGMIEGYELANSMARILRNGGALSDFEQYNERWTETWRQLHGIGAGLIATPRTDPWISARADRILACLPAHGEVLASLAAQLGLAFEAATAARVS